MTRRRESRMNYRILSAVALAATVCLASPALACKGNNVLFEDNFADDSNWGNIGDGSSMADGIFTLKAEKGFTYHYFYRGDTYDTVDICLDVAQLTEGDAGAGILFAAEGAESYYQFWVNPLGGAGVSRYAKNRWVTPVPFRRVKLEGKKATLRLTLRGSKATAYVNDNKLADFKVTPVEGGGFIGIGGDGGSNGITWGFSNLKVTDVP